MFQAKINREKESQNQRLDTSQVGVLIFHELNHCRPLQVNLEPDNQGERVGEGRSLCHKPGRVTCTWLDREAIATQSPARKPLPVIFALSDPQ